MVRKIGLWIIGLSVAFMAIPIVVMAAMKGLGAIPSIGPSLVALIFATVLATLGVIPTLTPKLWDGAQANGTADPVGRFETRLTSVAVMGFAGLLFLIGAGSMLLILPSALSN